MTHRNLFRDRWLRRADMALTVIVAVCFPLGLVVAPLVLLPVAALAYIAERLVYRKWREASTRLFGGDVR